MPLIHLQWKINVHNFFSEDLSLIFKIVCTYFCSMFKGDGLPNRREGTLTQMINIDTCAGCNCKIFCSRTANFYVLIRCREKRSRSPFYEMLSHSNTMYVI